jgi:hypothetical protein
MVTQTWKSVSGGLYLACLVLFSSSSASAAITGPYTADANTLHLYHLDESAAPLEDTGFVDANDIDLSLTGVSPTLSQTSFSGFGSAVAFPGNGALDGGTVLQSALQGANGAFSYEALINISGITSSTEQQIMAHGDSSGQAFQFRISTTGDLQFVQVAPSVAVVGAAIPVSGPEAFAANQWFHVAVTYDGASAANLYWTRVDSSRTTASLLTSGSLSNDVTASANQTFLVGNRTGTGGLQDEQLLGMIDEVRISSVARTAGQFIFTTAVPEPNSLLLIMCGSFAFIRAGRRGRNRTQRCQH